MNQSGLPVQVLETIATPAQRILDHLHIHGGSLNQSERELARQLGLDRNAARRAMLELSSAKLITHQPTSKGTKLNLISS
jgi:DNA-binding FadR family transcriptional regulator